MRLTGSVDYQPTAKFKSFPNASVHPLAAGGAVEPKSGTAYAGRDSRRTLDPEMMDHADDPDIRIPKTAEVLAERIRSAIIQGEIEVGSHLPSEARLIQKYKVSRPTIKEAIRILEYENFIKIVRGARHGATVQRPTTSLVARATSFALRTKRATLGDLYKARSIIEPPAARMAAETRPREAAEALRLQLRAGEAVVRETASLQDLRRMRLELAKFHGVLLEQSGNITLGVFAAALQALVNTHQETLYKSFMNISLDTHMEKIEAVMESHRRLIGLIAAGDGAGAEAFWKTYMESAGRFWLDNMSDQVVVDILE